MKVSKEIVKKVKRLDKIAKEKEAIRNELHEFFWDYIDGVYIIDYAIVNKPYGEAQGEGEYCDQLTGYNEDSGSCIYYYPIEDSKKYVAILYEF